MRPDYWTIQNSPRSGVTSLCRLNPRVNYNGYDPIAEFKDAVFAMKVADLLNHAAAGERAAEQLIPRGSERIAARKTRVFAVGRTAEELYDW